MTFGIIINSQLKVSDVFAGFGKKQASRPTQKKSNPFLLITHFGTAIEQMQFNYANFLLFFFIFSSFDSISVTFKIQFDVTLTYLNDL